MDILYASLSMTVDESDGSTTCADFCLRLLRETVNHCSVQGLFVKLQIKSDWLPRATGYGLQTVIKHPNQVKAVHPLQGSC